MPDRIFPASYDSTTKILSAVLCVAMAVIAWFVHVIFIVPLFPLLVFLGYAYSPRAYIVSRDQLVIKRLIGNLRLPLTGIRAVRRGTTADFTGMVRLWGSGGFFGYYGLFRTSKLGKSYWYATRRDRTAIVTAGNRTLVLSPDDLDGFLSAMGTPIARISPSQAPAMAGNLAAKIAGFGLAALVVLALTGAFLYAPGPPGYTFTADSLTIHDLFYPVTLHPGQIDPGGIRIIDLTRDSDWRPTLRTNGFANTHYQSGSFRVANGKTVRLYRAGGNRLVLIPPKGDGRFILYQAADPDQFLRELRRWACLYNRGECTL